MKTLPTMLIRSASSAFSRSIHSDFVVTVDNVLSDENKNRVQEKLAKNFASVLPRPGVPTKAAVLIPLGTVKGEPSILFTLRSNSLANHRGEVSFPGGKIDIDDKDTIHTAIRESEEELGICATDIDIWGKLQKFPDRRGKTLVQPVLANCGEINIEKLTCNASEVEEAFTISISSLCNLETFRSTHFKPGYAMPVYLGGPHKIWGLTAIFLHNALCALAQPGLYKNYEFSIVYK